MRALRYHGVNDLRVDNDIPEPQCKPHEIKIKPAYIGICGTDLHEYSTPTFVPQPGAPHGITVSLLLSQAAAFQPPRCNNDTSPILSLTSRKAPHSCLHPQNLIHSPPTQGETMPVGVGHEFSGTIIEIGSSAKPKMSLQVGDKVAVQPTLCCFQCPPCT